MKNKIKNYNDVNNEGILNLDVLGLSSCVSDQGPTGPTGPDGENGLSAYEIALLNGYAGSETEWLAGLKGNKGPAAKTITTIPYFTNDFRGRSSDNSYSMSHEVSTIGFGGESTVVQPLVPYGFPEVIVNSVFFTTGILSFSSAYDFTIKSLSFSVMGQSSGSQMPFSIYAAIYVADIDKEHYVVPPGAMFKLNPDVVDYDRVFINVDGVKDFNIPISAGQKVAVGLFTVPLTTRIRSFEVQCIANGGMTIEFD